MNKKKELLKIIRSYEDSRIVTESLEGCIADSEYDNLAQSIIKLFAIPDVVGQSEQLCGCKNTEPEIKGWVRCKDCNDVFMIKA